METLSVAIITLNEEKNITACLKSVSWAHEIVVLDSGSTDRTVELCQEYTNKIFFQKWSGYSAQKNKAFDLTTGDWILSLDADERVTPELAVEIKELLERPQAEVAGYYLLRKVFYRGKWLRHGGFYPEKRLRLFRRGLGRCGPQTVHETIEVDGTVNSLKYPMEHHSYDSVKDYLDRMETYSTLQAEEYLRQGRHTGPLRMSGHAGFTFIKMFFLRRGFLDGYEGFLMACLYSMYTFVKYAKLLELSRSK
ncbi:MAG: glycosyltransferase family 2 protein [Deltaproteobacteria bacterium]|nr:glycosyltransferase family 2 protein [Deltaproteobacteria bacterium]MBW2052347.1 glycosyltransferase family 2 protein [Deltaproteobacteria bacterium]MBW2139792.1 glycosyltransferase family 2 protein [Deltaproteobacteria bacterium]MBW2322840.1 glycosyltransferase family 2 protein [Deltaproteobacteria bacterium]